MRCKPDSTHHNACDCREKHFRTSLRRLEIKLAAAKEEIEKMENDHLKTIDERDEAEQAIGQAYYLIFGNSPEWSNNFNYENALEEIKDAVDLLKQSALSVDSLLSTINKDGGKP